VRRCKILPFVFNLSWEFQSTSRGLGRIEAPLMARADLGNHELLISVAYAVRMWVLPTGVQHFTLQNVRTYWDTPGAARN
jgi:hypothetical protein